MHKFSQSPWAITLEQVFNELGISEKGLTEHEAEERLGKYGTNVFHTEERAQALILFLKQFISPLIFLLIIAAIVTAVLKEPIDTGVIIFAVLLNVCLGFFHEYHAENTLRKLTTYIKDRARVLRGGRETEIDSSLLVPGDIIKLAYGSRIPADSRIISVNNFRVDEAILTGESMPVEKKEMVLARAPLVAERINIAHAGSLVVEGYATAVVYATGNHTEIGRIAGEVSKIKRAKTPLQNGVGKLAWLIFFLALVIVTLIFALGVWRGESVFSMLALSAAVAVGAVPEALPITLTVILAIGAEKIAARKGIVRKLAAAETLGSTTLIMTDKTGTLTLADMRLVGVHETSQLLSLNSKNLESGSLENSQSFNDAEINLLEKALANVDVSVENPKDEQGKWIFRGRPFEVNIAKACSLHCKSMESLFRAHTRILLPFNSTNKFSVSEQGGELTVMGAPDILLKRSNISKEDYLKIENWINETSRAGKRIVGIASLPQEDSQKLPRQISPENINGLNFLGVFVFFDPIRPEVPSALKRIESHGVKMVLVTGDLVGTALSVANSLNWHVGDGEFLTGNDLRNMKDDELMAILPKIKIFARVTPEDKLRIGELYRKMGEIVAMTGDGVNDSPALKAMDIGISLGSASDVAKSAADLVLLDDNFQTISHAIEEGRRILSNIRKAFVYLMSNSLDAVFVVSGSLILNLPFPLTALQIIWVNLFTGSLPALAFAFDEHIDKEKYTGGGNLNLIFSKEVKALAFGVGIVSSFLLFMLYYLMIKSGVDVSLARSVFFVCFSSYILFVAFSFRSLYRPLFSYKIFSNTKLNWSILLALVILVLTMGSQFMRNVFGLAPLPFSWVLFVMVWNAFNILLVEAAKYFMHRSQGFIHKIKIPKLTKLFR